tara:strand:+ start:14903 stop:16618 length:1716 start_codon:yes stop_codon:yes gene_type:complete
MLPALLGGGITMGIVRAAGGLAGGALSAVGGAANLAATTLGIGAKVAGAGLSAIGGGAKALGSAINPFSSDDSEKTTPAGGDTLTIKQPKGQQQKQEKAVKQQQASATKTTKIAQDTSRKSDKSSKNATGALAAIKMQLEKLNDKVGGIIRLVMSGQKADKRSALESKAESTRDSIGGGVQREGVLKTGKKLIAKTGGFLSTIFGLIIKFFLAKLVIGSIFPELSGQFDTFQKNIVGIFKNSFDAIKKLFAGDFEGAKESAGLAFTNLKGALKGLAKFASDLLDKIIGVFGFEELNLYEEGAKKLEKIKQKIMSFVDEKSGLDDASQRPLSERIFNAIKNVLLEVIDKLAQFLSFGNLKDLFFRSQDRAAIRKKADEQVQKITSGETDTSTAVGQRIAAAKFGAVDEIIKDEGQQVKIGGKIYEDKPGKRVDAPTLNRLLEQFNNNAQSLTPEEISFAQRVQDAIDRQRVEEIKRIRKQQNLELEALEPTDFEKQSVIRDQEKKLIQKVSGAELSDKSAGMSGGNMNIMNDNSSSSTTDAKKIVNINNGGNGGGHDRPLDNDTSGRQLETV